MNYDIFLKFEQSTHYDHMKKVLNDFQNTNRYYQLVSYTENFMSLRNILTNKHVVYATNEVGFIFAKGGQHGIPFSATNPKIGTYLYQYHTGGNLQNNSKKYIFTNPENIKLIKRYHRKDMANKKHAMAVVDFNKIVSEKDQTVDFIVNDNGELKWNNHPKDDLSPDRWRQKHWGTNTNPLRKCWFDHETSIIYFELPKDLEPENFHKLMQTLSTKTQLPFTVDVNDNQTDQTIFSWSINP